MAEESHNDIGSANDPELNRIPFQLEEDIPGYFNIHKLKDNPDKLVREERMYNDNSYTIDRSISHYSGLRKMFYAMRDNYGIGIPDIDMVIGERRKGERRVFMVVDKIEGRNLGDFKDLSDDEKEKFEIFYVGILQSIFDSYKNGKPFFNDAHTGNIRYGHKSKEKGNVGENYFLIDVGDAFVYEEDRSYNTKFFANIIAMMDTTAYGEEERFKKPIVFGKIRSKLREIWEYCETNRSEEVKKYLKHNANNSGILENFLNK